MDLARCLEMHTNKIPDRYIYRQIQFQIDEWAGREMGRCSRSRKPSQDIDGYSASWTSRITGSCICCSPFVRVPIGSSFDRNMAQKQGQVSLMCNITNTFCTRRKKRAFTREHRSLSPFPLFSSPTLPSLFISSLLLSSHLFLGTPPTHTRNSN